MGRFGSLSLLTFGSCGGELAGDGDGTFSAAHAWKAWPLTRSSGATLDDREDSTGWIAVISRGVRPPTQGVQTGEAVRGVGCAVDAADGETLRGRHEFLGGLRVAKELPARSVLGASGICESARRSVASKSSNSR